MRKALSVSMRVSLKVILADENRNLLSLRRRNRINTLNRWCHIKKIVPSKCSYMSGNFDLIQGIRLFLELARKIGLMTMMKYQNFEKKIEN